jgi:hypothetical protein
VNLAPCCLLRVVGPEECEVMILFNDGASEKEVAKFASFLANNGYPVFCNKL